MVPRGQAAWSSESGDSWAEMGWVGDKGQMQGLRSELVLVHSKCNKYPDPSPFSLSCTAAWHSAGNAVLTFSVINHQWLLEPKVTLFS